MHPVPEPENNAFAARTVLLPGGVAVTVRVAPAAAAAAAAPAAAAAASAPAAAATAAPAPAAGREAAARRAWSAWGSRGARVALMVILLILGCAAAALALFVMALPPANSRIQGSCAPTDEKAAGLRAASELLLLSASAQVVASAAALLAPASPPVAFFAYGVGCLTAYRAVDVVWFLVACHGRVRGALAFHLWFFEAALLTALLLGLFTATR